MIWFAWLILAFITLAFLITGFIKKDIVFLLAGSVFMMLLGLIILNSGIEFNNGFVNSNNLVYSCGCCVNGTAYVTELIYNRSSPSGACENTSSLVVSSINQVSTPSYYVFKDDLYAIGFTYAFILGGLYVLIMAVLGFFKKEKKGSLIFEGED